MKWIKKADKAQTKVERDITDAQRRQAEADKRFQQTSTNLNSALDTFLAQVAR